MRLRYLVDMVMSALYLMFLLTLSPVAIMVGVIGGVMGL
jgi:type III secretory pathway component EscS